MTTPAPLPMIRYPGDEQALPLTTLDGTPWDIAYPPVPVDTPAIRWACSRWPGDPEAAPLLSRSQHRYIEDAE